MALSAVQQQALIALEVGDTPDGRVSANVAAIWADYADKALLDARLQVWYTTVRCIDLALGYERTNVDYGQLGVLTMKAGQSPDRLLAMRKARQADITMLEAKARARRGGVSGTLTTTEIAIPPEAPNAPVPNPYIDATDSTYAGSPYYSPGFTPGGPAIVDVPPGGQ